MPMTTERQYRLLTQPIAILGQQEQQKRIESDYYVEGYATTFEPYLFYEDEGGAIYEKFERDCFAGCDMSDIIMQYDHQGKVYARKSNQTLIVEPDDKGLFICADLSRTTNAKNLYEDISQGMITKMSWGFLPLEWHYDEATRTIIHTKIKKIFDISAVSIPANDNTNIHARALFDGEIRRTQQELLERETRKQKLLLTLKLEGIK